MRGTQARQLTAVLAAATGGALARRRRTIDLDGRRVLVTGSSRGLGYALARAFAERGASIAINGRDEDRLAASVAALRADHLSVTGVAADIGSAEGVTALVGEAAGRLGGLDVLVNNAGIITVGPLDNQTVADFERSLAVMLWGTVHATRAALPLLRRSPVGRIANITSIGGKVPTPHLVPYAVAKSAAIGFSESLHAELAGEGIPVTTVVPGLMRTGSHINATMKGRHSAEYRWFGLAASLPVTATGAGHAARRIVAAVRRGQAEVIVTWQAQLGARLHGLAPGIGCRAAGVANRLLPGPATDGDKGVRGADSDVPLSLPTVLARRPARVYRQSVAPPEDGAS